MTETNRELRSAINELALGSSKFGLRHSTFASPADSFHCNFHKGLKADKIPANPPFNMSDWDGEWLAEDARWKFGSPPASNANYAWVQHFIHHLAPTSMAGFVLAKGSMYFNQSGQSEIRKAIVGTDLVDRMEAFRGLDYANAQQNTKSRIGGAHGKAE